MTLSMHDTDHRHAPSSLALLAADDAGASSDDPDYALPAPRPKGTKGRSKGRRTSASGSGTSSSSSASSDSDGSGGSGAVAAHRSRETRSGQLLLLAPKSEVAAPLTAVDPAGPAALSFAELRAADRARTAALLAGQTGGGSKGKERAPGEEEMVRVRVKRRFAGEDIWEERDVPVSSKEARIWGESSAATSPTDADEAKDAPLLSLDNSPHAGEPPSVAPDTSNGPLSSRLIAEGNAVASSSRAALPPAAASSTMSARPPPPKKRKSGGLAAAALAAKSKGKKMTTLEKSAMDWRAQRNEMTEAERCELARNRQKGGGGFIERQEFLGRVEGRLD